MDFRFLCKTASSFPQVSKISIKKLSWNDTLCNTSLQLSPERRESKDKFHEISLHGHGSEYYFSIVSLQWKPQNLLVTQKSVGNDLLTVLSQSSQTSVKTSYFCFGETLHVVRKRLSIPQNTISSKQHIHHHFLHIMDFLTVDILRESMRYLKRDEKEG